MVKARQQERPSARGVAAHSRDSRSSVKRKTLIATLALALTLPAGAASAADEWTYRNPAQPSKNPDDLKDSQYRGWHYERKHEGFRKCVMARESGGNYKANGNLGSGAYQFIQSSWNTAMERANMPEWIGVRPHKAPPFVQDAGFWVMANPYPKKKGLHGRHHWSAAHALTIGAKVAECG